MTMFNRAINLLRKLQAQGYLEPHEFDLLYEALEKGEVYKQKVNYLKGEHKPAVMFDDEGQKE